MSESDVCERVSRACNEARDGDLADLMHLRWRVREVMEQVNMAELTVPELAAMTAILAAAHGRRLVLGTIERSLLGRPVLRVIPGTAAP